ncbi:hypothetical protein [Planococcus sp. 107-1]|uniref:hypothetical protein n=1 Tax=Planococcus sp. 107-1 TaxID=2908840 RepID=UPI001F1A6BF3|nr:hypothetical protein [Planococcus sp. 107-1]UJF26122.1 hypothetical protein L0M13_13205 [Planococcus sp. 107-1]
MKKNVGIAIIASVIRIKMDSTTFPKNPAQAPTTVPISNENNIAAKPTINVTRPPWSMRAKTSRLKSSVPKGCCKDQLANEPASCKVSGSVVQNSGPKNTTACITTKNQNEP